MDFFDTEDEQQRVEPEGPARRARREPPSRPPSGGDGSGGAHPSRQQIRSRQLTLAAGAIVVLILLTLAFRACVDARNERSFQNYVSDLNSLAADTDAVSQTFFEAFSGESDSGITLGNEIAGSLNDIQVLLDRAANLDAPDDLSEAQSQVVLSYQLRRDALAEIADKLAAAQGEQGANSAQKNIATQMEVLLASDVLYGRAATQIEAELLDQEIVVDEGVPESEFLPDGKNDPDYLDLATVQSAIAGSGVASGGAGNCGEDDDTLHGLELTSTTLGGVVLQPGAANTVPADGAEFEIAVTNQGDADESDVQINISGDLKGSQSIDEIASLEAQTVNIPAQPAPAAGDSGSVTVRVEPVCFEEVDTNNESTYDLTFE